ncbi:MAG: hypothetical protein LUF30_11815 [Lachnospiraceae bacterium]|nr:hypothetical protein [Lachnospiraceae bacterium]
MAGAYLGAPQNDLGMRTDVIDGCGKAEGMMMLLRAMTPRVIAVDELGSSADGDAVENALHCGCQLIATVHGASVEELARKPLLEKLLKERTFERFVLLSGAQKAGEIRAICDGEGKMLISEPLLRRGSGSGR